MSSDKAIQIENVSKCYHIYDKPRDRLLQGLFMGRRQYYREFWALRDISFEVNKGEAFAIIGRNGAGKSTLLQIIAGTLSPTSGTVQVNGRIAALLELGSGFNNEFTGRENVWMNASILGLSQDAIGVKFDEIASFADIGDFMDQPIKTYSSGMMMRLAFAVQTAIDPAILIVDEALAVGDVFFQAKCMMRLRKLVDDGVTLLFVSHDTATVRQICSRAVLLSRGSLRASGSAVAVTDAYLQDEIDERNTLNTNTTDSHRSNEGAEVRPQNNKLANTAMQELLTGQALFEEKASYNRSGNGLARFLNVQMLDKNGGTRDCFDYGEEVTLRQVVRFKQTFSNVNVSYKIRTSQGSDIIFGDTRLANQMGHHYEAGHTYVFDWTFKVHLLHSTYYVLSCLAQPPAGLGEDWRFLDMVPICLNFSIAPRAAGMIDGYVVWDNQLRITTATISGSVDAAT